MNASDPTIRANGELTDVQLRDALSRFATGVTVVTTLSLDGTPVGLTVDSFNSVSMDPPLILWSIGLESPVRAAFKSHPAFVVNILSEQQVGLCRQFATRQIDRFEGVSWQAGLHGAPVLAGTVATLQCLNYRQYPGGDHEIFLGEVIDTTVTDEAPLIYNRGKFTGLA